MPNIIPFHLLPQAELIIDSIYEGGSTGNVSDDPLSRLMNCGNQGGFRRVGRNSTRYAILYSSFDENDWPDNIDIYSGKLIYYGDNRQPGRTINDTPRGGNRFLEEIFRNLHSVPHRRSEIPPIFIFSRYPTDTSSRSVQFRGLVVPGASDISSTEDLIAIWKSTQNQRFQNYKAVFTILDISHISRSWIEDLKEGNLLTSNCSIVYSNWILNGIYNPLISPPTIQYRTIDQQTPQTHLEESIILFIYNYFINQPTDFEKAAATLIQMYDARFIVDNITRPAVDGGRDVIGRYQLGLESDSINLDFAMEVKCYSPGIGGGNRTTIGVKELSRLISRIRHRQFGILMTTSMVSRQAYEELRSDGHPILIFCGVDIARLLIERGYSSLQSVQNWLEINFPNR